VKVVITEAAKLDLIGIGDYIGPHNPERAASFVEELLDHCQALAELPRRHPWSLDMSTTASVAVCTPTI
jgi:plasmid stabilization system protein ParE